MLRIGGYTPDTGGSGTGLTVVRADASGTLHVVAETAAPGPSFLAAHPSLPLLYAVLERDEGGVAVFSIDQVEPRLLVERPSGGSFPCHLAVDPTGRWLAVANYGDGTVVAYRLDEAGIPAYGPLPFPNEGDGPDRERQAGPHAHQVVFGPGGVLHTTDLGTDEVRRFLAGDELVPHPDGPVRLMPGSGPRHLARRDGTWFVVGELDGTVAAYDDDWRELARVPASGTGEKNCPSHIEVSADGRRLYVGNRGPDTLSVFAIDGGRLTYVAEVRSGGSWPRHFALAGDRVYVANERSNEIAVLRLVDGIPEATGQSLKIGSPTCVLIQ